jgi:hypothetical protein
MQFIRSDFINHIFHSPLCATVHNANLTHYASELSWFSPSRALPSCSASIICNSKSCSTGCADVASSLERSCRLSRHIAQAIATLNMLRKIVKVPNIIPMALSIGRLVRAERCGRCIVPRLEGEVDEGRRCTALFSYDTTGQWRRYKERFGMPTSYPAVEDNLERRKIEAYSNPDCTVELRWGPWNCVLI